MLFFPGQNTKTDVPSTLQSPPHSPAPARPIDVKASMYNPAGPPRSVSPSLSSASSGFVKIPPGGRFVVSEKIVPLPIKMVPTWFDNKNRDYFQPRDQEMSQIRSALLGPHSLTIPTSDHNSFLIVGLGGVGKTELACRFASESLSKIAFEAVFWLTADSEARLTEDYANIATELGLISVSDSVNRAIACETFRTWLGDPVRGAPQNQEARSLVKWLLVLDNAEDSNTIKKFWPDGSHGSIVVTTRNPRLSGNDRPFGGKLSLTGLAKASAAQLLRHCADDEQPDDEQTAIDATQIVEWFQGFPLAIEQLGQAICEDELTISGFKRLYPTKSALYAHLHQDRGNNPNLVTSWALDNLHKAHKDAFSLLVLISMLDSEGIEDRILKPRQDTLNSAEFPMTQTDHHRHRSHLSKTSLIHVNRQDQVVRAHRIVQDVTIEVSVRYELAARGFAVAIARIAEQWPFLNKNYVTGSATVVDRWVECRLAYPHILRLMEVHSELKRLSVSGLANEELAELLLEAVQ